MRNKNIVKQFGRTHSHRKMMFNNMVTSLFEHERIVTTKQKGKELKRISEKLITKAKKNLNVPESEIGKRLHNKKEVMKVIKNRTVVAKLFDKIAPRFKDRNGGYTRLYLLGRRPGDAAEMAIVELVEREVSEKKKVETEEKAKKETKVTKKEAKETKKESKEAKKEAKEAKKEAKKDKKESKEAKKETKKDKKEKVEAKDTKKDKKEKDSKDKKEVKAKAEKESKKTVAKSKDKKVKESKKTVVMTKEDKEKKKKK